MASDTMLSVRLDDDDDDDDSEFFFFFFYINLNKQEYIDRILMNFNFRSKYIRYMNWEF